MTVTVVVRGLKLGGRDRVDTAGEVELRQASTQTAAPAAGRGDPMVVNSGGELQRLLLFVLNERPPGVLIQRLVRLEELALCRADDPPGLAAMEDEVAIGALQAETEALGHPDRDGRLQEECSPEEVRDVVD